MRLASPLDSLPDRPATWFDVLLGAGAFLSILSRAVDSDPLALEWVAAGIVATVTVYGPLANSALGDRVNAWWERIGVGGRALAIVAFAVVVWTLIGTMPAVREPVEGISVGVFAVIFVFLTVFVLRSRPIRGWMPRYDLSREDA